MSPICDRSSGQVRSLLYCFKASLSYVLPSNREIVCRRDLNASTLDLIGLELAKINWSGMYLSDDVQLQADFFYSTLLTIIDNYAPFREFVRKGSDKPWITPEFKSLIFDRDSAFKRRDDAVYKRLRNKVNRLRCVLQCRYYNKQVDSLKKTDQHKWWKSIKNICGFGGSSQSVFDHLTYGGQT